MSEAVGMATSVHDQLGAVLNKSRTLASGFSCIKSDYDADKMDSQTSRCMVLNILETLNQDNPGYIGFSSGWKPNAMGSDHEFIGTKGHDA